MLSQSRFASSLPFFDTTQVVQYVLHCCAGLYQCQCLSPPCLRYLESFLSVDLTPRIESDRIVFSCSSRSTLQFSSLVLRRVESDLGSFFWVGLGWLFVPLLVWIVPSFPPLTMISIVIMLSFARCLSRAASNVRVPIDYRSDCALLFTVRSYHSFLVPCLVPSRVESRLPRTGILVGWDRIVGTKASSQSANV